MNKASFADVVVQNQPTNHAHARRLPAVPEELSSLELVSVSNSSAVVQWGQPCQAVAGYRWQLLADR